MRKYITIATLVMLMASCNKYEDGPSFSLRSAKNRLTGQWKLSKIIFNDKDISQGYFSSNLESFPFSIYTDWSRDYFIGISYTDGNIIAKSDLELNRQNTKMTFALKPQAPYESVSTDIFCTIPALHDTTEWKILRLKNDELWIKTDFENNNYEIHFDLLADLIDY